MQPRMMQGAPMRPGMSPYMMPGSMPMGMPPSYGFPNPNVPNTVKKVLI